MRLKKLIISGCTRFTLSMLKKITYTPQAVEQVILGSNGSGKSSLLELIITLVPNGNDFEKGGFKEYHLEHNGHEFVLISTYNQRAGTHNFFMNGVDLNDGNTQATQRELVEKYIGLTPDLEELLSGRLRFSELNPAQRRDWLMRISGTDFTFAIQLYEHFRQHTRRYKEAMEYMLENTQKMAGEIENLRAEYQGQDEEIAQLKELSVKIDDIVREKGVRVDLPQTIADMQSAFAKVRQSSETIIAETRRRPKAMVGMDRDDVQRKADATVQRLNELRGECNENEKALEGIHSLINHVGREAMDNPSSLENDIVALSEEIAQLTAQGAEYPCHGEPPERLLAVAESIQEPLSELCVTIPTNTANKYTRGGHNVNVERLKVIRQTILEHNNLISKLQAQLDHATHTQDANCPQCNFSFKPGWDPALLKRMAVKVEQLYGEIATLDKEANDLVVLVEDFDWYSGKLGEMARLRESSKSLRAFWESVAEERLIQIAPATIPVKLSVAIGRLQNMVRVGRLTRDLDDLKSRLELVKNSGDPKYLLQRADLLENQLHDKGVQMRTLVEEIGALNEELYHLNKLNSLAGEMEAALETFQRKRSEVEIAIEEKQLLEVRERCLTRLGVLHQHAQRYHDLLVRYESNREQIREAEVRHASFSLITKAMSPTEGIIADTVKGFITHFVRMLNEHISMVWSYDMEVRAVVEEGVSLNCKFPVYIGGSEKPVPDVKNGSTGQVSMIDFAFKLVVAELLGLVDYPLLADEFGKDFDDEHRERLVQYIKSLVEQGRFSQLFMVSHYSSVYGSFNQAEFVVLDDRNITRPNNCNEHLEFE